MTARNDFPDWCVEMLKLPTGSVQAKAAFVAALVEQYDMPLERARVAVYGEQVPVNGRQRYKIGTPCK